MTELIATPLLLAVQFARYLVRHEALVAENLFLRQQLKLYIDRGKKPRRATDGQRLKLVLLSKLFDWRDALVVVQPETFLRWHRKAFRLFWKWKSRVGRPPVPAKLRRLIREMATDNPLWGEERIASELLLKLGVQVSPRTVRKYMPKTPRGSGKRHRKGQSWSTFLRNHEEAILACDFCNAVTMRFQVLHVFLVMHLQSRRILHVNVTRRPSAAWTLQQFREALPWEHEYQWLIHDCGSVFSKGLDESLSSMGLAVLRTPPRTPVANAFCERVIGTLRRECLDHVIPWNEQHLRRILNEWLEHYNQGRPHSSLGPGLPEPRPGLPVSPSTSRHELPPGNRVTATAILGGLHHEYALSAAP